MVDGEGDVRLFCVVVDGLDDVVDEDVSFGEFFEEEGVDSGLVGQFVQADAGDVVFEGCAADDDFFEVVGFVHDVCTGVVGEAASDSEWYVEFFCEFDGTDV